MLHLLPWYFQLGRCTKELNHCRICAVGARKADKMLLNLRFLGTRENSRQNTQLNSIEWGQLPKAPLRQYTDHLRETGASPHLPKWALLSTFCLSGLGVTWRLSVKHSNRNTQPHHIPLHVYLISSIAHLISFHCRYTQWRKMRKMLVNLFIVDY